MVEDHAQRINVAKRSHGPAADLLRAGESGRQHRHSGSCEFALRALFHYFRDT